MRKYAVSADDIGQGIRLLLVDDEVGIIDGLTSYFKNYGFEVDGTTNPMSAIEKVKTTHYDIIILDYLMAPIHGDQVVESIRQFNDEIYILLLTGHKDLAPPTETLKVLDIQGYCEKSDKFDQLLLLVESGVKYTKQLKELRSAEDKLRRSYMDTVYLLRDVVDLRDNYTKTHSDNVSILVEMLGNKLGLATNDIADLKTAGIFHDIGKIAIPDAILNKPDRLTDEEYEVMKKHPVFGSELISKSEMFNKNIVDCIRYHHERYDGKGYPEGLKGESIPYFARILSVADAFDAMRTKRIYKESVDLDKVLEEIERCSGSQFDPDIAEVFLNMVSEDKDKIINSLEE